MKVFQVPPVAAAVILAALCMGMVGLFVLVPIACIQWTWNSVMVQLLTFPQINIWQATLLYLAIATLLYLTGIVEVDFQTHKAD